MDRGSGGGGGEGVRDGTWKPGQRGGGELGECRGIALPPFWKDCIISTAGTTVPVWPADRGPASLSALVDEARMLGLKLGNELDS